MGQLAKRNMQTINEIRIKIAELSAILGNARSIRGNAIKQYGSIAAKDIKRGESFRNVIGKESFSAMSALNQAAVDSIDAINALDRALGKAEKLVTAFQSAGGKLVELKPHSEKEQSGKRSKRGKADAKTQETAHTA